MARDKSYTLSRTGAEFQPTHWSLILARDDQKALGELCAAYWPPIYAFLRSRGKNPQDAQDLTQGFFAHILSKERLQNVHPAKGKFRSFLLACLQNYLLNEHDKEQALKRGGGRQFVPIDCGMAETNLGFQPSDHVNPALLFERQWATTLVERVLQSLKQLTLANGDPGEFETLLPFLTDEAERGDYHAAAEKLHISQAAVRVRATRLRARYKALLREEVAATVDDPAEVDGEIDYLFSLFQSP